jgi:hypothetical protein
MYSRIGQDIEVTPAAQPTGVTYNFDRRNGVVGCLSAVLGARHLWIRERLRSNYYRQLRMARPRNSPCLPRRAMIGNQRLEHSGEP